MSNSRDFEKLIDAIPFQELEFGYRTLHFYKPQDLPEAQLGYSRHANGTPLVGSNEGDWQASWIVIAHDDVGDPIFIDAASDLYPVFAAAHGQGKWEPVPVASTLQSFFRAAEEIASVAKGREYPTALEANPLSDEERRRTLEKLRKLDPDVEPWYWEIWLAPDLDVEINP